MRISSLSNSKIYEFSVIWLIIFVVYCCMSVVVGRICLVFGVFGYWKVGCLVVIESLVVCLCDGIFCVVYYMCGLWLENWWVLWDLNL